MTLKLQPKVTFINNLFFLLRIPDIRVLASELPMLPEKAVVKVDKNANNV